MTTNSLKRCLKVAGALMLATALSGCIVVPGYGPAYGYYRPHPHYYY